MTVEDSFRELGYCLYGARDAAAMTHEMIDLGHVTDAKQAAGVLKTIAITLDKALELVADLQYTCEKSRVADQKCVPA